MNRLRILLYSTAILFFISGCINEDLPDFGEGSFTVVTADGENTFDTNFGFILTVEGGTLEGLAFGSQNVKGVTFVRDINSIQLAGDFLVNGVLSAGDFDAAAIAFVDLTIDSSGKIIFEEQYEAEGTVSITSISETDYEVTYSLEGIDGVQITGSYTGTVELVDNCC